MVGYYKSHSNRCYFSSRYRIRNSFFITPHTSERREQRKNHHKQIVDALNIWYKKDIKLNEELNFKTIDSLYVSILEELGIEETVVNDNNPQTVEQMILSHLNSKVYTVVNKKYENIKIIQNEHNKLVSEFITNYKEKLKQLLGVNNNENEYNIEILLQFILYKVYYGKTAEEIDLEDILEYSSPIVEGEYPNFTLNNPYPKDKEKILEFLIQNFDKIKNNL